MIAFELSSSNQPGEELPLKKMAYRDRKVVPGFTNLMLRNSPNTLSPSTSKLRNNNLLIKTLSILLGAIIFNYDNPVISWFQ